MGILTDLYNKVTGRNVLPSSGGVTYIPSNLVTVTAKPDTSVYRPIVTQPAVLGNSTSSSGGSGSSGNNYQVGGWYGGRQWDGSRFGNPGEVIVGGSSNNSQNFSSTPSMDGAVSTPQIDYDALFQPGFQALQDQEKYLQDVEFPQASADIEKNRLKLNSELTDYETSAKTQTEADKTALTTSRDSALSDAVKSYNALRQQRNARFGSASSAGEAVGELAQQEFFRSQGNIQGTYQEQMGQIMQKASSLYTFLTKKKTEIDTEAQNLLTQARNELTKRLMDISAQKGMLEQAKSQAKIQALNDAINFSRNINQMKIAAQLELDTWKQQQEEVLKTNWQQLNQQAINTNIGYEDPGYSVTAPGSALSQANRYRMYRPEEDEYSTVINPFNV